MKRAYPRLVLGLWLLVVLLGFLLLLHGSP